MQLTVGFDLDLTLIDPRPAVVAVAAVRAAGGRVVVVTAKSEALARTALAALGVEVDDVVGWRWAEAKAGALLEHGATVYVGVRTGGVEPAGADVLLEDLTSFPEWFDEHLLDVRLAALEAALRRVDGLLVAFSGGADSAFLLAAAARALGPERVVAATAVSPSLAADELPAAQAFAASLGVRHLTPATDELSRAGYVANGTDRCFHCKATLLDTLRPLAAELGLAAVATGTNADDVLAGFRPGISAAAQRGALTPLLDAGLTKAQVRAASRRWALATADKPALACLASRIAYGLQVTPAALARVDRAERALRAQLPGVVHLRVRDLGDGVARLELDPATLAACGQAALDVVRAEGFDTVTAREFRSGSMNDGLAAAGAGADQQAH